MVQGLVKEMNGWNNIWMLLHIQMRLTIFDTIRTGTKLMDLGQNLLGPCPYRVDPFRTRKFRVEFVLSVNNTCSCYPLTNNILILLILIIFCWESDLEKDRTWAAESLLKLLDLTNQRSDDCDKRGFLLLIWTVDLDWYK